MSQVAARALGRATRLSWAIDLGVAIVLITVFWLRPMLETADTRTVVAGTALSLPVAAAVVARWALPGCAPAIAFAATGVGWVLQVSTDPMLAVAWCLYPLALRRGAGTRVVGVVTAGVLVICSALLAATSGGEHVEQRFVIAVGAMGASWLLGHVEARRLGALRRSVEQQAEFDRMRTQTAMAREVHDVVGHALSVISAEADVARRLRGTSEHDLRESLAGIERRSRSALEEVQGLVRALRAGEDSSAGAMTLPSLVAAAEASGLEVHTRIDLPTLPSDTDLVMSRVVQEALSNVVRHSGATRCEIAVRPEDGALTVRVDDDGAGLPVRRASGSGLHGMRERVEGAGGTLTVATRLEGGTRVLARLPLERVS